MEINEIMKLVQAVSEYGLTSFELEEGNMRISLKREKEIVPAAVPVVGTAEGLASGVVLAEKPLTLSNGETVQPKEDIGSDQVVTSPLVGVFYAASSPDAQPFVKVGDTVKKGQVLGIIEAMKLMNEIESEVDGVVEAILVKNEETVEYGQPLFRIR
ncbi:MAG: acetyl-CoA carboxylase biotin carboxyl carrier protein [Lachnospiraceae bacterium]|nr:acetyl-CoA carboxylase biotin carboxyl carrier protein [Lachnospiraceae bacterium]